MAEYKWELMAACDSCGAPAGERCQRRRGYDSPTPCLYRRVDDPEEPVAGRSDYAADVASIGFKRMPNLQDWEDIRAILQAFAGEDPNTSEGIYTILRKLTEANYTTVIQVARANWSALKPLLDELNKEVKQAELLESYGPDVYAAGTAIAWSHKRGPADVQHVVAIKQTDGLWNLSDNWDDRIRGTWEEIARDFWLRDDLMYQPNIYTMWERIGKGSNRAQA